MTNKPRGLAALKLSNPDRFWEIQRKATANSGANFKHDRERARILGAKGGRTPRKAKVVENDLQENND